MRPHDANARASVRSPVGRTHAATVTSLLGTPGFQPPGLMEMRMRHAAAFAGEPARFFDIHPAVSAVSPRQEACIRASDFDRPTVVFDLELLRGKYRALDGRPRRPPRSSTRSRPTRRPRWWRRSPRSAGVSTAPRAARSTSACRSASRPSASPSATPSSAPSDIAHAHAVGVGGSSWPTPRRRSRKIARHAPRARVILRMLVEASDADWPLSRKFGCSRREALRLMDLGRACGLDVAGISFHAGSQMREPMMWAQGARRRPRALGGGPKAAGHDLRILNIGGGFPAFYGQPLPATEE